MKSERYRRRNIEMKARLHDIEAARQIAEQVMTSRLPDQHQRDTYFDCRQGRLKLREINGERAELIAYNRCNERQSRSSAYTITPIVEPGTLIEALGAALGLRGVVEKRREIYLHHNVRIHLDEVTELGCFLEFEAVLARETPAEEGHQQVAFLRDKFAVGEDDLIAVSYSDLLLNK